jgi:hypothetical protein
MSLLSAFQFGQHLAVRVCAPDEAPLPPESLHVAILLDVSYSMTGERLDSVKQTLRAARPLFRPSDRVTLITFSDRAITVCNNIVLDDAGITAFYSAVDALGTHGGTNLSAGFEELARHERAFDAVVLLTDGLVTSGVKDTVALRRMAQSITDAPLHVLGYGEDHNHVLARDLAINSRGTYTFVDNAEILPVAVGNILTGLRDEVFTRAVLTVDNGWVSMEIGCEGTSQHRVGGILAGREYWSVFQNPGQGITTLQLTAKDRSGREMRETRVGVPTSDCYELSEQVLRCRVVSLVSKVSENIASPQTFRAEIAALAAEMDGLDPALKGRPLVLLLRAQLAEAATPAVPDAPDGLALSATPNRHAARLASGTALMSCQRGVSQDPTNELFSTMRQRETSQQMHSAYMVHPGTPGC